MKKLLSKYLPTLASQNGVIMIGAFIITLFFLTVSIAAAEFGVQHYTSTRRTLITSGALNSAEAAADAFMFNINSNTLYQGTNNAPSTATDSCTGYTPAPVTLVNNSVQGKVTYESCVKNGTISGEKLVYTTGKVYLPATSLTPFETRKLKLVINQSLPANYTVMTGPAGLHLSNNVQIVTGPVFVGGKLVMENGSAIGSIATPTTVYVGDKVCPSPADSTYPLNCGSSSVSATTDISGHIYGDTHVLNTVDNTSHFTLPGVTQHDTIPAVTLPPADHAALTSTPTASVNSGGMASKLCSSGTMHLSGHYTGSITTNMTIANNCIIYIDGDTWLDGNLVLGNNNVIAVSNSLSSAPNLIIDGSTGLDTGSRGGISNNGSNIGLNVYTFWSAASCTPSCSNLTGTNLANSQGVTTIDLENNFTGAANTKFYAVWSQLVLGNNSTVGQLLAQKIDLRNNGSVIFGNIGGGTGYTWDVRYYEQIYQ